MRKEKRMGGVSLPVRLYSIFHIVLPVLALLVFLAAPRYAPAAENSVNMGTSTATGESTGIVIGKDPATGTRVMRTPEPKPQPEYQGPQTVIVAPEVYPGRPGSPQGRPPRESQRGK